MDHETFISRINRRFQALFGRITLFVAVLWIVASALYLSSASEETSTAMQIFFVVGSLLLSLFAMRVAVLLRGKPLYEEVRAHASEHALSLDALILQARSMDPRPEFFLSLVDGPLASRRRGQP